MTTSGSKPHSSDPIVAEIVQHLTHESERQPGAILLTGEWGAGKTYLWRNQIAPSLKKYKHVYVSLFGVATTQDLKSRIMTNLLTEMAGDATGWKGKLDWGVN